MPCRDCHSRADAGGAVGAVLHCHGEIVRHHDGAGECSEPGCTLGEAAHEWVVACEELEGGCTDPICSRAA